MKKLSKESLLNYYGGSLKVILNNLMISILNMSHYLKLLGGLSKC